MGKISEFVENHKLLVFFSILILIFLLYLYFTSSSLTSELSVVQNGYEVVPPITF